MAAIIVYEGTDVSQKRDYVQEQCSVSSKTGITLSYNKENKMILHASNETERANLFVDLSTAGKLKAIIPFRVFRDLTKNSLMQPKIASQITLSFDAKLREYQDNDSKRIINALDTDACCYFQAYPGYGKTIIIAYLIAHLGLKTLIIVPNLTLVTQTVNSLEKTLPQAKIFVMGTDHIIPEGVDIVVCFRGRLNCPSPILSSFKFVVFDEVHMLSTPIGLAGMMSCRPERLLAVTATGGDRNSITEKFVGRCEIQSLSDKTWYIVFPRIYSGLDDKNYEGVTGYTNAISALAGSEIFMKSIVRLIIYFYKMRKRTIVITMRKDMRDILEERIKTSNPRILVGALGPDKQKCGNSDVIIGTHKFIGTGFDLSSSVNNFDGKHASVLIFLGSIKDETLMYQIAGRAFRAEESLAIFPRIADFRISCSHCDQLRYKAKHTYGCIIHDSYAEYLEQFTERPVIEDE
jgi:superfamily II DNA or RNA helicase